MKEVISTGIAALVRVAKHHGLEFRAEELVRAHPFEGREPAPPRLRKIAEGAGLRARLLTIQCGELVSLAESVPAILLLTDGRAVVLEQVQQEGGVCRALVEDPSADAAARALLDETRLFEFWSGEVLLVQRRFSITDENKPFGVPWLIGQLVKERRLVRDIAIAAFFMSVLSLLPVMLMMIMIDRVLYNKSLSTLGVIALAAVILVAFDTVFGYLRRYLILIATSRIDARISIYIFDKLINLRMSYFERVPTGEISGKIGQIYRVRNLLMTQVFGTLLDGMTLFVLLRLLPVRLRPR